MYVLPQVVRISHHNLVKHLKPHGYEQVRINAGIWTHKKRTINFAVVVGMFCVKYEKKNVPPKINHRGGIQGQ